MGFPGGARGKETVCQCRRPRRPSIRSLGQEDPLEEGMAAHSSILVWRIPWTEEPGRLQSVGSQRVRYDWSNLACTHARKPLPNPWSWKFIPMCFIKVSILTLFILSSFLHVVYGRVQLYPLRVDIQSSLLCLLKTKSIILVSALVLAL